MLELLGGIDQWPASVDLDSRPASVSRANPMVAAPNSSTAGGLLFQGNGSGQLRTYLIKRANDLKNAPAVGPRQPVDQSGNQHQQPGGSSRGWLTATIAFALFGRMSGPGW